MKAGEVESKYSRGFSLKLLFEQKFVYLTNTVYTTRRCKVAELVVCCTVLVGCLPESKVESHCLTVSHCLMSELCCLSQDSSHILLLRYFNVLKFYFDIWN